MIAKPPLVIGVNPGHAIGPTEPGYAKTETGCSSLSSFESMSPTLSEENWGMHAAPFYERNYPCDPIVLSYFNSSRSPIDLDLVDPTYNSIYSISFPYAEFPFSFAESARSWESSLASPARRASLTSRANHSKHFAGV